MYDKEYFCKILNTKSFLPETFSRMKAIFDSSPIKLNVCAFEYVIVYDDNTASLLYSNADIARYMIRNELHISAHVPKEIISPEFWFIPPSNSTYSPVIRDISEMSGATSFINYIKRHNGYYEMFCFWDMNEHSLASNKFINMKEALEQYSRWFTNQARGLIAEVNKDKFILSPSMLPNFRGLATREKIKPLQLSFYLEKAQNEINMLNEFMYPKLSKQELRCIPFLMQGKTVVDIAETLHLSPRTIEMHLNSIKIKTNSPKKSDIINSLIAMSQAK